MEHSLQAIRINLKKIARITCRLLTLLLSLMLCNLSFAQPPEPIQTDRPDQTESPFTVPKYYLQAEYGFSFEKTNGSLQSVYWPSVLWRYGISNRLEFRLVTELLTLKTEDRKISGLNPLTVGFKLNLFKSRGVIPATSFLGLLTTSGLGSKEFRTTHYSPSFKFAMENDLSDQMTIGYNLGAQWNGETSDPSFLYSLSIGFAIIRNLSGYTEIYGYFPYRSIPDHRFDTGVSYLISKNIQTDLSGGLGLSRESPAFYIAAGFSFRFSTVKSNKL